MHAYNNTVKKEAMDLRESRMKYMRMFEGSTGKG